LPEVVEHGKTGVLCSVDCPESFAQAAYKIQNADKWLRLSSAARKRALTLFQEKIRVDAWVYLYEKLAQN
jgi:glycosyltransferase involved in cell wall biosynthesis